MTKEQMKEVMIKVFQECMDLRDSGHDEYAHTTDAFANFNRLAERLGLDRKSIIMVYAEKHIDGIHAFVNGHKSQREDIEGRINDVIVYLCLLRGIIMEERHYANAVSDLDAALIPPHIAEEDDIPF